MPALAAKKKKPTKKASLIAMLNALEGEIDKQKQTIEVAEQRLANLEADRDRLKQRIEECGE